MLEVSVLKGVSRDGSIAYEADGKITETKKGKRQAQGQIDNAPYIAINKSLKLLANHLVTFMKLMADEDRWTQFGNLLKISFPRTPEIFHPVSQGVSRIKNPLSDEEIKELWEHIFYYTEREEIHYE